MAIGQRRPAERMLAWARENAHQRIAVAWCVVFIGGTIPILALPIVDDWKRLAIPVALLVLYCFYGCTVQRKNTATFADSLYFLGFLWTLVALISALWHSRLTSESVLPAFGYALVTTAAGMALRLVVVQFQEIAVDRVEEAQENVDARLARLIQEFDRLAQHVALVRVETDRLFSEELGQLRDVLRATRQEIDQTHRRTAAAANLALDEAVRAVAERLHSFELPHEPLKSETRKLATQLTTLGTRVEKATTRLAEQVESAGVKVEEAWGGLADRVQRFELPLQGLRGEFGRAAEAVREGTTELVSKVQQASGELAAAASEVARTLSDLPRRSGLTTSLERAAVEIGKVEVRQAEWVEGMARASDSLREAAAALGRIGEEVRAWGQRLEEFRTTVGELSDDAARAIERELRGTEETIRDAREAAEALERAVSQVLAFIRERLRSAEA